jgi:competence protein ComEA
MVLRDEKKKFEIRLGRMSASTRIALNMPIDVNSASMAELELVPGIGEKTAQKIIEARNQKGKFHKLEEMMKINELNRKNWIN